MQCQLLPNMAEKIIYFLTATTRMMAPMTTLKWSSPSLLENTSMCMETWMMMASMKVC